MLNTLSIIIAIGFVFGANCDQCSNITCPSVPPHYRELGCVSQKNANDCCIARFECQDFKSLDINKCHYNGRTYEIGDKAPADYNDACEISCSCKPGGSPGRPAYFECADFIECPILKEFHLKYCVQQHVSGVCCPELKCPEPIKEVGDCWLDGEKYKIGQVMAPKSSPCHSCVCSDKFDNSTIFRNPSCKEVNCDFGRSYIHYFQMDCVPLYFQSYGCCTVAFRCPKESDVIINSKDNEIAGGAGEIANGQCKFGKLTFKIGEELNSNDPCVSCTCSTPPMLHCVRRANCLIQTRQNS